jgi:hypothetical protein
VLKRMVLRSSEDMETEHGLDEGRVGERDGFALAVR